MPAAKKSTKHKAPIFDWFAQTPLTLDDAHDLMLVKGVMMREGHVKSGEIMTRDNVIFGTGGMSESARRGNAIVDIDHYAERLPEKYVEKYGVEINEPYPVGYVLDCQAVEGSDGKMEVQGLMALTNRKVYDMIGEGKFKGNSVVDYYRKLSCDEAGSCAYEGSSYTMNTLVLDEVPNSEGTSISQVDEDDIGTIITHVKKSTHAQGGIWKIMQTRLNEIHAKKQRQEYDILSDYLDEEGIWINGEQSIRDFLIAHKEMTEDQAADLAAYMFANPDTFNEYQIAFLSSSDLLAWMDVNLYIVDAKQQAKKQQAEINDMKQMLNVLLHSNPALKVNMRKYTINKQKGETVQ